MARQAHLVDSSLKHLSTVHPARSLHSVPHLVRARRGCTDAHSVGMLGRRIANTDCRQHCSCELHQTRQLQHALAVLASVQQFPQKGKHVIRGDSSLVLQGMLPPVTVVHRAPSSRRPVKTNGRSDRPILIDWFVWLIVGLSPATQKSSRGHMIHVPKTKTKKKHSLKNREKQKRYDRATW